MSRKTQFSDLGKDGCLLPPTLLCIHEEEDDFNEQGEENLQTLGAVTFADLFAPIRQVRIEPDQTLFRVVCSEKRVPFEVHVGLKGDEVGGGDPQWRHHPD